MKIESPAFTMDDVKAFMSVYRDRERNLLADRLQQLSQRIEQLGPLVERQSGTAGEWSAQEILAHIAVVSKFYGVLVHRIAGGKLQDMNLLEAVNLRDSAGQAMAELEPAELVRQAVSDHARTIQVLRDADPASLQREARIEDGTTMSAEEVARMPLITHLEMHIEQLEKMLDR